VVNVGKAAFWFRRAVALGHRGARSALRSLGRSKGRTG
jgi:hypothetical protein